MFFLLYFLLSTFFSNLTSLNTKSQTLHVGNPLQCSCLENPRDREAWWAAVYGVAQSRTRLKRLSSSSSSCSMFKQLHIRIVCACSISQSCLTLLQPCGLSPASFLCPWDFPGKNTGMGCHFLLQKIFLTQGSNPHLLYCRQILCHWATWEAHHMENSCTINKLCCCSCCCCC